MPEMTVLHEQAEVFLPPGALYFGTEVRLSTLLGSCVAITFWHPQTHAGGMCHYLLPGRAAGARGSQELDGRYADEAVELLRRQMAAVGTTPTEYEAKIFGGGSQFDGDPAGIDVPVRNIRAGLELLAGLGLRSKASHLGGTGPRQVVLDLATGDVLLRYPAGGDGPVD